MKKLFSVLMVAVVATMAFAFTTPKAAFSQAYHLEDGVWEIGPGGGCGGSLDLCEFTTDITVTNQAALQEIAAGLPGTTQFTVDADGDNQDDDVVNVSNIRRFVTNP